MRWRVMLQSEVKAMNAVLAEQIAPELAQVLIARAAASGLSVNDYLARLLGVANGAPRPTTDDEFIAAMESMAEDVPPLPRDFSREDIYFPEN
jgi:hypothetical protein